MPPVPPLQEGNAYQWQQQQQQQPPPEQNMFNPQAAYPQQTMAGSWDSWGNWQPSHHRPLWKIPKQNTEGLFKFDGEMAQYKNWQNRVRDHASEEWPAWRDVLDHAATYKQELTMPYLQSTTLFGVNASHLSADLWSFLLRWIGPQLYMRRTKMGLNIEGNGLELWRRIYSEYAGSDKLIQIAGRTKLQDYGQCKNMKHLSHHVDDRTSLFLPVWRRD